MQSHRTKLILKYSRASLSDGFATLSGRWHGLLFIMKNHIHCGTVYGRLTVVSEAPYRGRRRYISCKCVCGNIGEYRLDGLKRGTTQSCGCLKTEATTKAWTTHGLSGSLLYNSWRNMKQRCLNENCRDYIHYGARGISFCAEWNDFLPFYEWAIPNGYKTGLTIERIDVNGNYEPNNCKWIPQSEQLLNTRRTVNIAFDGITICRKFWAKKIGISESAFKKRLANWSLDKAITHPVKVNP